MKQQLNQGGGKLFQFMSKSDQAFLNVDWTEHTGSDVTASTLLKSQLDNWASYRNSDSLKIEDE